jgi:hypothetical protein
MPSTEEIRVETPVVEDTFLDQVGEMWKVEGKKAVPTFLAYLNYQVYGREHALDRQWRRTGAREARKEKTWYWKVLPR